MSSVSPEDGDSVVLGKTVSDLQSNVIVNDDYIQGTLKYVSGWTDFSGNPEYQSGNYLALKFEASEGATTTVELLGGVDGRGAITLDSDMQAILRITNLNQKVKVVTTLDGESVTKTYGLRMLELKKS